MCNGLLSERQIWQITIPFAFTAEENTFLSDNPLSEKVTWSSSIYKPIKDRIRAYYLQEQNCTCSYCRLPLNAGTDNIEIEHIIDKGRREAFTFEPLNLVVSCHNCNFNKTTKRVLHNCPDTDDYPPDGTHFKIVHGHFDNYFHNIEFREGSIYHALTQKGEDTISICKLSRIPLAEQREQVEMYHNDPVIAKIIEFKKNGETQVLDELIQRLTDLRNSIG
jgi:uncharacterized protein (TIGR02646 family)